MIDKPQRERWNKLSDGGRAMLRLLVKYADTGRCHLNDLRKDVSVNRCSSRRLLVVWRELENRGYGQIALADEVDPVFVIDVGELAPLLSSSRLTDQAPEEVDPNGSPDELTYPTN